MTAEEVIAAARARSGLADFGDPAILEGSGGIWPVEAGGARERFKRYIETYDIPVNT